jgi:phosphoglycerate dehydrogenase-like enzyme
MKKILVTPPAMAKTDGPYAAILRGAGFDVVYSPHPHQLLEEELTALLPGIAAVVCSSEPYTRAIIESAPELRVIARVGVGYDAVDVAAASERGVAVTITPGTNHDAVAELTFTLLLALTKNLVPNHLAIQSGRWPRRPTLPVRGKVLGIVGLGRIGRAVALRGLAFGMTVIACDPFPDQTFSQNHPIPLVGFDRLVAEADFLSLHAPLIPETKYLINRRSLALMKPTAFLINTARGGLVCESDLLDALMEKRLAGAGLDVFEREPPGENPLVHLPNVVLTPHVAGVDVQSLSDMAAAAARSIVALSRGEWPADQVVNRDIRSSFQW